MEEKWCSHLRWDSEKRKWYGWIVWEHNGEKVYVEDEIKFCAWCGKPRPEPRRKKLWEILRESWVKNHSYPEDAKAAIEAVEAVIDETEWFDLGKSFGISSISHWKVRLKEKLRELL